VIYIPLEGFRYSSKEFTLHCTGGIHIHPGSFTGIINHLEGYLNPSSGNINPLDDYLNPSSGILNTLGEYLNPSSGVTYKPPGRISESLQWNVNHPA